MQTLKEMSLAITLKFGVGPRGDGDIPSDLKEQLNATEYNIQMGMTGRFHHHIGKWDHNKYYNIK